MKEMALSRTDDTPIEAIRAARNPDGGWPYRKGGSWTEPTVYALLAHRAGRAELPRAACAFDWLRGAQQPDGGFAPRQSVAQSTWVTALVALLPPALVGARPHARAVAWLLNQSGMEASTVFHLCEFLRDGALPATPELAGWPWFPGTAAWVTPTSLAILALEKCYWDRPSPILRERIEAARAFLLSRRCADGGWNYGAPVALGYRSGAYPETTGQALVALRGVDPSMLQSAFALANRFLQAGQPAAATAWLRLGLLAHRQLPASDSCAAPPSRTVPDAALSFLATAAEQGNNVFFD